MIRNPLVEWPVHIKASDKDRSVTDRYTNRMNPKAHNAAGFIAFNPFIPTLGDHLCNALPLGVKAVLNRA